MKNLTLYFLLFSSSLFAQELQKSPVLLEVYAGGLNQDEAYRKWIQKHNDQAFFLTTGGTNPIGIRADFMRFKRLTFGFDFMYNQVWANYFINYYDSAYQEYVVREVDENVIKMQLYVRTHYLFPISTDKVQLYATGAIGYNYAVWYASIGQDEQEDKIIDKGNYLLMSPLAFKLNIGTRFFLTKRWGLHMEAGYGGPWMSAGISFRMVE